MTFGSVSQRPISKVSALAILAYALLCLEPRVAYGQNVSASPAAKLQQQDVSLLTPIFLIQRDRYRVGEPIMVRLGFRNDSRNVIDISSDDPPWYAALMTIIGPDGKSVPRGLVYIGGGPTRLHPMYSIPPRATQYLYWGGDWYPLENWSFQLNAPGTYRITVRRHAAGTHSINVQNERTTTATVTIEP